MWLTVAVVFILSLSAGALGQIELYPGLFHCSEGRVVSPVVEDGWRGVSVSCTGSSRLQVIQPNDHILILSRNHVGVEIELNEPLSILLWTESPAEADLAVLSLPPTWTPLGGDRSNCHRYVTNQPSAVKFSVCVSDPEPHRLQERADTCCDQMASSDVVALSCDCRGGTYNVTTTGNVTFAVGATILASSIHVQCGGAVFQSSVLMNATDIAITCDTLQSQVGAGTASLIGQASISLTTRNGSASISGFDLWAPNIAIQSATYSGSPAIDFNSVNVTWSDTLLLRGQSDAGAGVYWRQARLNAQGSGRIEIDGTSQSEYGVEIVGPVETTNFPPNGTVIHGVSHMKAAVVFQDRAWSLSGATINATCPKSLNDCSGFKSFGSHDWRFVTITGTGSGIGPGLNMSSVAIAGSSFLSGNGDCLGALLNELHVYSDSALELKGQSTQTCPTSVGLRLAGALNISTDATFSATGHVSDASVEAYGIQIWAPILSNNATVDLRGVSNSSTASFSVGVTISESGSILSILRAFNLAGTANNNDHGIGVYCAVGSLENGSIISSVLASHCQRVYGIFMTSAAVATMNVSVTVECSSSGTDRNRGAHVVDSAFSKVAITSTLSDNIRYGQGAELLNCQLNSSSIDSAVVGREESIGVTLESTAVTASYIVGLVIADMVGSGALYGVQLLGSVLLTNSSVMGQCPSGQSQSVAVAAENVTIASFDSYLFGSSSLSSTESTGIRFVNAIVGGSSVQITVAGGTAARFSNSILESTDVALDAQTRDAVIFPPDLSLAISTGSFKIVSVGQTALLLAPELVSSGSCQLSFQASSESDYPIEVIGPLNITGTIDLALGNCSVDLVAGTAFRTDTVVTGTIQSSIGLLDATVYGFIDFQLGGNTQVAQSLNASQVLWTGDGGCQLSGSLSAVTDVFLCSTMRVGSYLNSTSSSLVANSVDCGLSLCDVQFEATTLTLLNDIGLGRPVRHLTLGSSSPSALIHIPTPLQLVYSDTLYVDGNVNASASVVLNGQRTASKATFLDQILIGEDMNVTKTYQTVFRDSPRLPGTLILDGNITTLQANLEVPTKASGRLELEAAVQVYNEIQAIGDMTIVPAPGLSTNWGTEHRVDKLSSPLNVTVSIEFTIVSPLEYSRLLITNLTTRGPIHFSFAGPVVVDDVHFLFGWNDATDLNGLRCTARNSSLISIVEGTECAITGEVDKRLRASLLVPSELIPNTTTTLSFKVVSDFGSSTPSPSPPTRTSSITPSGSTTISSSSTPTPSPSSSPSTSPSSSPSSSTSPSSSRLFPLESPSLSPSASPSITTTPSASQSKSISRTRTVSPSSSLSRSGTSSDSRSPTPSISPSATEFALPSATASRSGSHSPSSTRSRSRSASVSVSWSASRSFSLSPLPFPSPPVASASTTASETTIRSPSATSSMSPTASSSQSTTPSSTPSLPLSRSISTSATPSSSASRSVSQSSSVSESTSSSYSVSPSITRTASISMTRTTSPSSLPSLDSPSASLIPSASSSPSATKSVIFPSPFPSVSAAVTETPTSTSSASPSSTLPSSTATASPRVSSSASISESATSSASISQAITRSTSPSGSSSASPSLSVTGSRSLSPSPSLSSTESSSPSSSEIPSPSPSSSDLHSLSARASLDPASMAGPLLSTPLLSRTRSSLQNIISVSARVTEMAESETSQARPLDTASSLSNCVNCETLQTRVLLSGDDEVVMLSSSDGLPVVTLNVPASYSASASQAQITVEYAKEREEGDHEGDLQSAVVDITLVVDGEVVTQLNKPLEICLTPSGTSRTESSELCLSYYDVAQQHWKCEDLALTLNAQGQLCGETNHLTSFALLLGGDTGSSGENFPQSTIAWISLGFIAGAFIVIVAAILAIEMRYLRKRREDDVLFSTMGSKFRELSRHE